MVDHVKNDELGMSSKLCRMICALEWSSSLYNVSALGESARNILCRYTYIVTALGHRLPP